MSRTGRPLKFTSPDILQNKIEEYFAKCDAEGTPYLITGLALHLDTSRETLINYENRDDFFDTVKRAKLRVEADYELSLRKRGSAGDIFGLKNFGWTDKTETEITGANGGPIEYSDVERAKRVDALLDAARARRAGQADSD